MEATPSRVDFVPEVPKKDLARVPGAREEKEERSHAAADHGKGSH